MTLEIREMEPIKNKQAACRHRKLKFLGFIFDFSPVTQMLVSQGRILGVCLSEKRLDSQMPLLFGLFGCFDCFGIESCAVE